MVRDGSNQCTGRSMMLSTSLKCSAIRVPPPLMHLLDHAGLFFRSLVASMTFSVRAKPAINVNHADSPSDPITVREAAR
jgi:hypothetical protein